MGISALAYSSLRWMAKAQKCGGVQAKMISTSSNGSALICPLIATQPSSGGAAPARPPITMFCGVARLRKPV
ncbi:hypothetical protein D9M71_782560 [compost metagenome]